MSIATHRGHDAKWNHSPLLVGRIAVLQQSKHGTGGDKGDVMDEETKDKINELQTGIHIICLVLGVILGILISNFYL